MMKKFYVAVTLTRYEAIEVEAETEEDAEELAEVQCHCDYGADNVEVTDVHEVGVCNMYSKRLKCKKCGKTLLTGCARNVVSVECSCGEVTYPNDKTRQEEHASEKRHNKYR